MFKYRYKSIKERIKAINELHLAVIRTYAMISLILPRVEKLAARLSGKVDYVLIDRINYH